MGYSLITWCSPVNAILDLSTLLPEVVSVISYLYEVVVVVGVMMIDFTSSSKVSVVS